MGRHRLRKIMFIALCGGTLLQATGCEAYLAPLVTNVISAFVINALLGGLVT